MCARSRFIICTVFDEFCNSVLVCAFGSKQAKKNAYIILLYTKVSNKKNKRVIIIISDSVVFITNFLLLKYTPM